MVTWAPRGGGVGLEVRGQGGVSSLWAAPISSRAEPLFLLSVMISFKEMIPQRNLEAVFHRSMVVPQQCTRLFLTPFSVVPSDGSYLRNETHTGQTWEPPWLGNLMALVGISCHRHSFQDLHQ